MAERVFKYEITLTEMPHFRRLVEFVDDVETLARRVDDDQFLGLVDTVRADLIELLHDWGPDA